MCSVVKLTCGKGFYSKDDLTERKMSHRALLKYFNFNLTTMFTCQINHRPRQRKESIFILEKCIVYLMPPPPPTLCQTDTQKGKENPLFNLVIHH